MTDLLTRMAAQTEWAGECLEWTGTTRNGYGTVAVKGEGGWRQEYTHRRAYELANGPIPPGRQIDHLCRNRRCCNAAHLEAVTQAENIRRGESISNRHAARTHCDRGHEFTPENTGWSHGYRRCRACRHKGEDMPSSS